MPKDFALMLESTYKQRQNYAIIRMREIQATNSLIYKKNQNVDAYKEAIDNVEKLHSQASKPV